AALGRADGSSGAGFAADGCGGGRRPPPARPLAHGAAQTRQLAQPGARDRGINHLAFDTVQLGIFTHSLPQPSSNGGPMTCWALMRHLLDEGHRVTVVTLRYPND